MRKTATHMKSTISSSSRDVLAQRVNTLISVYSSKV